MARFSTALQSEGVAAHRKARGLTQAQLASLAGVTRQTLTEIEGGNYNPSTALALRLAILLDARVEEMFRLSAADVEALVRNLMVLNQQLTKGGNNNGNS